MKLIATYILVLILTALALHAQGTESESEQLFFDALTFAGGTPDSSRLDLLVAKTIAEVQAKLAALVKAGNVHFLSRKITAGRPL